MEVSVEAVKALGQTLEYRGKTYYFCTDECKQKFTKNPGRYIEDRVTGQGSRVTEQTHSHKAPVQKNTAPSQPGRPDSNHMGDQSEAHPGSDHTTPHD